MKKWTVNLRYRDKDLNQGLDSFKILKNFLNHFQDGIQECNIHCESMDLTSPEVIKEAFFGTMMKKSEL